VGVCLVWLGDPVVTEDVARAAGPWREIVTAAPGLLLVDSDESLSRVYHHVKWLLPDGCALLVAPIHEPPKARGVARGTVSWLRTRRIGVRASSASSRGA
jgi:hypothetical protein